MIKRRVHLSNTKKLFDFPDHFNLKLSSKRGKDLTKIKKIMLVLVAGETLPVKNRDHFLIGNYANRRECHIEPDWLLIYKIDEDNQKIIFERTGSHSDLF